MQHVIVTSTTPYSGKTGVCLTLIHELEARGFNTGYVKAFGTMPVEVDGTTTDRDAAFINAAIPHPAALADVCPVLGSRRFVEDVLSGRTPDIHSRLDTALHAVAKGRDVVVIEGPADAFQGTTIGLSACELALRLDARALLVDRLDSIHLPDILLGHSACLGDSLAGVVFNWVTETADAFARDHLTPFLDSRGIAVFGAIPYDMALSSVTVSEIVDALQGTVLTADEQLEEPVESFMVGAMGQEKALRFFRRKARKAVITGGDRADVQLAALETSTNALVLTGNFPPSSIVLARAEELGVPMILVDLDTLGAVERLEALMGHTRLHDPAKAGRIREMFTESVDVDRLVAALGLDI